MVNLQTIIIVIASLMLVKGIIIALFPNKMIQITKPFVKNEKTMRKGGMIGIGGAIVLFIISQII